MSTSTTATTEAKKLQLQKDLIECLQNEQEDPETTRTIIDHNTRDYYIKPSEVLPRALVYITEGKAERIYNDRPRGGTEQCMTTESGSRAARLASIAIWT